MFRKLILFATFLLTLTAAKAQSVGEWNVYSIYTGDISNVVDTPDIVYYTSNNRLFSYDKKANETYAYNTQNKLSDTNVSMIQYNPEGKYLFIGYDNSNIDLLYDNGRVINLCDIKDATLTYEKNINNVTFADGRIYIATDFGFIIFNDARHEVVESGIFGFPIASVFPSADCLVLHRRDNVNKLYSAPLTAHHNTFGKFTEVADGYIRGSWIIPLSDGTIIYQNADDGNHATRAVLEKSADGNGLMIDPSKTKSLNCTPYNKPQVTADNRCMFYSLTKIFFLNDNGNTLTSCDVPAQLKNQYLSACKDFNSIWACDAHGLANYSVADDGTCTVLSDKSKPEGISTLECSLMKFDYTGALWLNNLGVTLYKANRCADEADLMQQTTRIKDGKAENMSTWVASAKTAAGVQKEHNTTRMMGGCTGYDIDPDNPNRYFQGNNLEGLYVIENNEEVYRFDWDNTPMKGAGWPGYNEVKFDPEGNLWIGYWSNPSLSPWRILPRSVLRTKQYKDIAKTDWLESAHKGIDVGGKDMYIMFCKHSNVIFTIRSTRGFGFTHYPAGKLSEPSTHTYAEIERAYDQDGKEWSPTYTTCMAEDHRGRVWFGTTSGLVEVTDPAKFTETSNVTRIKVPRNDGTNYADYLCESDLIYSIAVDNSNRKWIATDASGVYLVSENGDKILEHFTTENSPLPSNQVLSVACDPNSNTVYFGLLTGLVSYNSDSSPAAQDYSDVYAYPNPVRPDYTGYITITGLMDNSLVKITDAQGHVVHQTRSEGGMAIWDGFDNGHNPVKSGVYFVMCSQDANGGSESVVTKIMIVR